MKLVIDIDEEDYDNICTIGGLVLPKDILYVFRGATPLEEYCDSCPYQPVESEDD